MKKISIFEVAYKNLLRKKTRSLLTILGIALAAWVLVSLFGFNRGYEAPSTRTSTTSASRCWSWPRGVPTRLPR